MDKMARELAGLRILAEKMERAIQHLDFLVYNQKLQIADLQTALQTRRVERTL
jgi:hypothetical protein